MIKYSRQRECILNNLRSRRDHPTADMVYESVRGELPQISLGTVYRNLTFLEECGQILKISTGAGADHFDGFVDPHNHFVCKTCGRVYDMDYVPREKIVQKAALDFEGCIMGYELKFFGKCKMCLEK